MNKHLPYLLFVFLINVELCFAQNIGANSSEINYADSAIHYLLVCQTAQEIDSTAFEKAIESLNQVVFDKSAFKQIEKITADLRNKFDSWFPNTVDNVLINVITRSDSLDFAINYCKNIIDKYAISQNPDERLTALTALLQLRIPLRKKDILESFDYYESRLKGYLKQNDSSAISISYFCIATTYRLAGLPDMTIYNIKKSNSYIDKNDTNTIAPISGLGGWMNNMSVLGQLFLEVGDYESAIEYSLQARDVRINILKQSNVSFLNCNIAYAELMLNDLDSVSNLLNNSIPLAEGDYPSLARIYQIKGQYFLALNMPDSAEANLIACKEVMQLQNIGNFNPAGSLTPNYFLAEVRISQMRFKDARTLLEQEIKNIGSIKKELLKEQKLLIEVLHKLGDSEAADSTFKKYSELQSSLSAEERKYRLKSFEVETKIETSEKTIQTLETARRIADLTKKYLIGIALLLLIVATIIFNRFRVTRKQKVIIEKEKQRSDELLLNILPEETAEELKNTGTAKAKSYNTVTVMFTDFKGFTNVAEKLSAEQLVKEIHECYSEFDRIIARHNLEKIKTIGDSYMCAGGLPVANATNAEDTVRAAIEIRDFMLNEKQKRDAEGKPAFEIRIGCHTGPVVAGIVGVKKFAYDIWGDTVNIASRMESSGETGKINISQITYELVKDKFICNHRGKITAKNKGEIDMYFVETFS